MLGVVLYQKTEKKMMKILFLLLLSGITISLSGCTDDSLAEENPPLESMFTETQSGINTETGTYTQKQSKVIVTQADYDEELRVYTGSASSEDINFSAGKILLVDMGERSTGGFSIEVTSVEVNENNVMANVNLTKPGQNCLVTTALTNPYQFIFIPTLKEVLITERITVEVC